jgi:hypothetical protein
MVAIVDVFSVIVGGLTAYNLLASVEHCTGSDVLAYEGVHEACTDNGSWCRQQRSSSKNDARCSLIIENASMMFWGVFKDTEREESSASQSN